MIDPSIPLGVQQFDLAGSFGRGQQIRANQMKMRQEQQAMADQQAERKAYGQYFAGGQDAGSRQQTLADIGRVSPEVAFKLQQHFATMDKASQEREAGKWKAAAPLLVQLKQVPPEQRSAYVHAALPALQAAGWNPQEIDGVDLSDQSIDALAHTAYSVEQVLDSQKTHWVPVGENGAFAIDSMGQPTGSGNPFAPGGAPAPQGAPQMGAHPASAPRGIRNNNPGNITISDFTRGQPGFAGTDQGGRYARFDTPQHGQQAQQALLGSYINRGFDTPQEIIGRWAPQAENGASTGNYTNYVAQQLGIPANGHVTPDMVPRLAEAMGQFENGRQAAPQGSQSRGSSATPRVMSKAIYDRMPSGTRFIGPDGKERVKP